MREKSDKHWFLDTAIQTKPGKNNVLAFSKKKEQKVLRGKPASKARVMSDLCELLTVDEAATHLKVHRQTVYGWIYEGKLSAKKVGRHVRVTVAALEEFYNVSSCG